MTTSPTALTKKPTHTNTHSTVVGNDKLNDAQDYFHPSTIIININDEWAVQSKGFYHAVDAIYHSTTCLDIVFINLNNICVGTLITPYGGIFVFDMRPNALCIAGSILSRESNSLSIFEASLEWITSFTKIDSNLSHTAAGNMKLRPSTIDTLHMARWSRTEDKVYFPYCVTGWWCAMSESGTCWASCDGCDGYVNDGNKVM